MDVKSLDSETLLERLKLLARQERENVTDVVAFIAEASRRRLCEGKGFPSAYHYCVKELGYSEAAAYFRIRAAGASRRYPQVLDMLRAGELSLEAVVRLNPHLYGRSGAELLDRAKGKSSREVLAMVAELSPDRRLPDVIRVLGPVPAEITAASGSEREFPGLSLPVDEGSRLPSPETPGEGRRLPALEPSPIRVPLILRLIRIAFTADQELLALIQRARELLRHKYPEGRLERIFKDALIALLEKRDPDLKPVAALPAVSMNPSRRIPQWVKDAVWRRDQGRCAFVSEEGKACLTRDDIEFDHIRPWASGGSSDDPANIRLLCRGHNQLMAVRHYGEVLPRGSSDG